MVETNVELNYLHNAISVIIMTLRKQNKDLTLPGTNALRSDLSLEVRERAASEAEGEYIQTY